jgi:hypothetical protein
MTEFLLLVIAICALVTVVLLSRIFWDLRLLCLEHIPEVLASLRLLSSLPAHPTRGHIHHAIPPGGFFYLIWEWRDGDWQIVVESIAPGIDPGPPPAYPGSFPGERVKTWAPRRTT